MATPDSEGVTQGTFDPVVIYGQSRGSVCRVMLLSSEEAGQAIKVSRLFFLLTSAIMCSIRGMRSGY